MLTRDRIKEELVQKGVNEKLLSMPAILERMYLLFQDSNVDEMRKILGSSLSVESNGDFSFSKNTETKFSLREDGSAEIIGTPYEDSRIGVNSKGIEVSYEDGSFMGQFSSTSRKEGKICVRTGNNATGTSEEHTYLDGGGWSITSKGPEINKYMSLDREESLKQFDDGVEKVTSLYPDTKGWYAETREMISEVISVQNNPQTKIDTLIDETEKLKAQIKAQDKSHRETLEMLSKTLRFAETVKHHPLGRVFFSKSLKELEKESLPSGNEAR